MIYTKIVSITTWYKSSAQTPQKHKEESAILLTATHYYTTHYRRIESE